MKQLPLAVALLLLVPVACGGPSAKPAPDNLDSGQPALQQILFGRLVDVYAYQRVDVSRPSRLDQLNRRRVLVQRDVVVSSGLSTQALYDAGGNEVPTANYEFMTFDINTGHDELLILWDNTGDEADLFDAALRNAQLGLTEIPASFRNQNTGQQPIPVVPRDAAVVLRFSANVNLPASFFDSPNQAVQLLEFVGDPNVVQPQDAFRALSFRGISRGTDIILDPTILGGEAKGGFLAFGMPPSLDNATANIRIALPIRGTGSPLLRVPADRVEELNGLDSNGRGSVIRDFRSGNAIDGAAGVLRDFEPPVIVGNVSMGILDIDANGIITLNRRSSPVAVRGRYPFVGGAIDPVTGFVLGPNTVPTSRPLRAGDFLMQTVQVQLPGGDSEPVRIRAEILQNLDVGTVQGDPNFPGVGLAADGTVAGNLPTVRVRVGAIRGVDSLGRTPSFVAIDDPVASPLGEDCEVRRFYYERIGFPTGSQVVSDSLNRFNFLKVDPPAQDVGGLPTPPGERINPNASFALEFSEPMDFESVDNTRNLMLSDSTMPGTSYADFILDAKRLSAGVVPTRWSDQAGDGTVLQLQPPMGLFHRATSGSGQPPETYWFHLLLGGNGITDLAGNPVELFNDDPSLPVRNFSVQLTLDPDLPDNLVGWHTYPFEGADEDGTPFGSIDLFGQYRLLNGRLVAAEAVRFNRTADDQNLGSITRAGRGECIPIPGNQLVFQPPSNGLLYWVPRVADAVLPPNVPQVYPQFQLVAQPVGLVIEPHQPRGSRMMMRYIEDDFGLSNRNAGDMCVDVEQLFWSPYADNDVAFDVLDRYSMALGHSDKRPDEWWEFFPDGIAPGVDLCQLQCESLNSSLSVNFTDNVLRGSSMTTVFEDKVYQMSPEDQFRSSQGVKYIPYPRFDRTYTWRDSRLITVDSSGNVIGLGGARNPQPNPNPPVADFTADVDSPWVPSVPPSPTASGTFVKDEGDFRGDRRRDHDPIALPLLVDFKVYPDTIANGGLARGVNAFQVAMLGPPTGFSANPPFPGGYYNLTGTGIACPEPDPWPLLRVHSTGGLDPTNNNEILVDPGNVITATGGWLKDAGAIVMGSNFGNIAIHRAPPGDGMLHWASADFVRRVSTVTFGFVDTMRPNQRAGAAVANGFPDFTVGGTNVLGNLRILDFVSLLDPPLSQQPSGTAIVLELRGAGSFDQDDALYNPVLDDTVAGRGNLLNPNYACEAYRYSVPNSITLPRIQANGLTRYVAPERIDDIRNPLTGLLPRFVNFRLVMTNNIDVTPALSPSLRSMAVVYRMQRSD